MRVIIRWQAASGAGAADVRARKLDRVREAALQTLYYQHPARRRLVECGDLSGLAPVPLRQFLRRLDEFYNPAASPRARPFYLPSGRHGRTAVLEAGFQRNSMVRVFESPFGNDLSDFAPHWLAGPMPQLKKLLAARRKGEVFLPSLRGGIVIHRRFGEEGPGERDRDMLWQEFGVPVSERLLGMDCETLAEECEARAGLHLNPAVALAERDGELLLTSLENLCYPVLRLATGLPAEIAHQECHCGHATPRLVPALAPPPLLAMRMAAGVR